MPCHAAMTKKFITLSEDQLVEEALSLMEKEGVDVAPVIDDDGAFAGIFSLRIVMQNLLPVSVSMADGLQLDVQIRAAPGIAKRLRKVLPLKVSDLIQRKVIHVSPETPLWEGVNLLVQHAEPVFVIDSKTNKVLGMIDGRSALNELNRMQES